MASCYGRSMSVLQPLPLVFRFTNRADMPPTKPPLRSNHRLGMLPNCAQDPGELRRLAAWYREIAERAENPTVWEGRLLTVDALEQEARCWRAGENRLHARARPAHRATSVLRREWVSDFNFLRLTRSLDAARPRRHFTF